MVIAQIDAPMPLIEKDMHAGGEEPILTFGAGGTFSRHSPHRAASTSAAGSQSLGIINGRPTRGMDLDSIGSRRFEEP